MAYGVHLTVPPEWIRRRLRVPPDTVLHFAALAPDTRVRLGAVQVTTVGRALDDCARGEASPDLLAPALLAALERKLVAMQDVAEVVRYLGPFDNRKNS